MSPAGPLSDSADPPRHGYRGATTPPPLLNRPRSLTVAISREAGSRGGSIAAAVGRLLGWQVFTQEILDFLAHDEAAGAEFLVDVPPAARQWADAETARLAQARELIPGSDMAAVARLIFILAARGDAVLVGRGAGFLLPAASTVHVRVVAPAAQRVAYMGQWLRMTDAEASAEIRARDDRRASFVTAVTDRDAADPAMYDLVLNSARLGMDVCAELIAQTVRAKQLPTDSAGGEAVASSADDLG
ncbi:AAA family ATPase [Fimbriiglobus ruber]|uniref:Pyrimidine-ribonucleotide metabolism n=1 Tax=Fimbriiglobus ruber TaxID=1908690 RepID=A0A225E777_9BACT|nr:cytidylate kinase-like family protein [Fimbriiglobus ruber]OWK45369.1 pyrimidine-ribonucleotide metabolism [Fimbriiglobus ruber]